VSKRITEALQLKIEKANFLADDLAFLIEKSTKLAAQLEQAKAQRVEVTAQKPRSLFEPKPLFGVKPEPQSAKPKTVVQHVPAAKMDNASQSHTTSSLEAVLQRLASGIGGGAGTMPLTSNAEHSGAAPAPRTDAERELFEALKSGR
jgi:hypothetical protein